MQLTVGSGRWCDHCACGWQRAQRARRRRRAQTPHPVRLSVQTYYPAATKGVAHFGAADQETHALGHRNVLIEDSNDIGGSRIWRRKHLCRSCLRSLISAAAGRSSPAPHRALRRRQSRGHQPDQDGGARIASSLRSRQRDLSGIRRHGIGELAEGRIRTNTGIAQLRCADRAGPGRLCDSRRHRPPHRVPGVGTIALLHRRRVCGRWWSHGIAAVTMADGATAARTNSAHVGVRLTLYCTASARLKRSSGVIRWSWLSSPISSCTHSISPVKQLPVGP